jgi:anti-sigma-K factor RskA
MTSNSGRASAEHGGLDDPELEAALQAVYAAPADDGYWAGLEGRIMARIRQAEEQGEWWGVFAEWRTAGLVAAGLMLTLASAALWNDHQRETDLRKLAAGAAYWTVFDGPSDDVTIAFTVPSSRSRGPAADRLIFTSEP